MNTIPSLPFIYMTCYVHQLIMPCINQYATYISRKERRMSLFLMFSIIMMITIMHPQEREDKRKVEEQLNDLK